MPEGSEAQQNFIPEPQQESPDETANLLAADKARDAGSLRTQETEPANDNYQPYDEEPANDNNIPQEENNLDAEPANNNYPSYSAGPANDNNTLSPDQQTEIAVAMAMGRQRDFQQMQARIDELQNQLGTFEKDLTDFKQSSLGGFLSIFQPSINRLIDSLVAELKKGANNLSDEAKVGYYTGLTTFATSLIAILTALKFFAAFLDALILDPKFSCGRLAFETIETIILPILIILISPIYVPFMALIFYRGNNPGLKGKATQNIGKLLTKLKKQRDAWNIELDKLKRKVALRRQIKALRKGQEQIKRAK